MTVTVLVGLTGCPGGDAAKRAQERLKKAEAEKAERVKRSAELDEQRQRLLKGEPSLGAPWDDAKQLVPDSPCPVGLWSLFPGPAPGADAAEKQANEAARGKLAAELKAETFMLKLRAPDGVVVGAFDPGKAQVGLEVKGSMECTGPTGRVTIAWGATRPGAPAMPIALAAPMASASEAQEWTQKSGPGLRARVAFRLGAAEGAVLHADVVGVRVASDQDTTLVAEKKTAVAPSRAQAPEADRPEAPADEQPAP
jgi:hypothetical protein